MNARLLTLAAALTVAGCGGATSTPASTAPAGTYTMPASTQPTRCSVWLQGHLAQIVFTSALVDVGPACDSWVMAEAASGELWIKNEVSSEPNQETNVCWLHDGYAFAEIQDQSGGFYGQQACAALITSGWQESGS